jgi:hypothetical protein
VAESGWPGTGGVLATKSRSGHLVTGGESEGTLTPSGILHFLFRLLNARPRGVRSLRLHQSSSVVERSSSLDQSLSIVPCHRLRRNFLRSALSRPIVTSARSSELETPYSLPQTSAAARLPSRVSLLNDVGARGRLSSCMVMSVWKLILNRPLFLASLFRLSVWAPTVTKTASFRKPGARRERALATDNRVVVFWIIWVAIPI